MGVNQNNENTSYLAGKVYVSAVPAGIPAYTIGTNEVAIETFLEANCTFSRLWGVNGLEIVKDFAASVASIRGDECDYVETKYARPQITINQDWLENVDVDTIEIITGLPVLDVASAPVAVSGEVVSTNITKGQIHIIQNKNGDNTIVSSIVVDLVATPLVLNTDYTVHVDTTGLITGEIGRSYIVFLLAQTGAVNVDYSYTPNVSKYSGTKAIPIQLPQLVVKIVGCPNASGKYNTHYLVNGSISGTITQGFVDLAQAGNPVPSPISFVSNVGGYMIDKIQRGL